MNTVNGVMTASSTVLSNTCDRPTSVPLPGGMFGPSTNSISGRTMIVPTIVSSATRQARLRSDHIDEAVHVADGLHRAAEAVVEAGRAGHEALPAVVARLARAEGELHRVVRHRQVARRHAAGVLRVVRDPRQRDDQPELRDREGV